jgi:aldose 1-epimerase
MGAGQEYAYTNQQGEIISLFTLRNSSGTEVKISNYGATITSFRITGKDGMRNDIVLGFDRMEDYLSPAYLAQYPWFGCAVGRYANRISNARFSLDGKTYQLTNNNGPHQLHGGRSGFDKKVWKLVDLGESPFPFVHLSYLSRDGDEGYPGNLDASIWFELNDKNELRHSYSATTDQPGPCNLTHHSYFNLNNGSGDIFDHEVKIHASHTLEQDDQLVATGNIIPVEGTAYDLRSFRKIGEGLKQIPEYDKSFSVDQADGKMKLVAEARYAPREIGLQVFSTEPIVHFYSGKWTPEVKGKGGTPYGPWSGFCLETHIHPNAVNIPSFPNTILRPGEVYRQDTIYKIV